MNLKLRIASIWVPEFLLIREINRVAKVTITCLNQLLMNYAAENNISREEVVLKGNIKERRWIMANAQNIRVKALISALGCEEATRIGREALFKAGLQLGYEARARLGVSDSLKDLLRAARVLYRVLGIKFRVEEQNTNSLMMVTKCALSKYYTLETCRVLSAADEGVVQGLNKNFSIKFTERITEGSSHCIACIKNK